MRVKDNTLNTLETDIKVKPNELIPDMMVNDQSFTYNHHRTKS